LHFFAFASPATETTPEIAINATTPEGIEHSEGAAGNSTSENNTGT
jgi:hypothetical protein